MFENLRKELGSINPETLKEVQDGLVELSPKAEKEFHLFMKMGQEFFAPRTLVTDQKKVTGG